MAARGIETVLSVHHWNESLFSFTTTRDPALRFENGHFVMMGLQIDGKPLMRAYSIVSANYEDYLEFLSIKVPDGPLTSQLQHLKSGDEVVVSRKPVGTLLVDDLLPGKHLYLLATGTGLAPFMSIIRNPETYAQFERVILVHGVRYASELAYAEFISDELPRHEYLGDEIRDKLIYHPTVTREEFRNRGRITTIIENGALSEAIGLPELNPEHDRVMLCGSPAMLRDLAAILETRGFEPSAHQGAPGHYVIERAFVEQ